MYDILHPDGLRETKSTYCCFAILVVGIFYYYARLKIDITVLDGYVFFEFCMLLFLYAVRQVYAAGENSPLTYSIPGVLMYSPTYIIITIAYTYRSGSEVYTTCAHRKSKSPYYKPLTKCKVHYLYQMYRRVMNTYSGRCRSSSFVDD